MTRFSTADKARITAAIHAAEKETSGEFVAVVARASDHYVFVPLLWAAMIALLLPGAASVSGLHVHWMLLYQLQLASFIVLATVLLFAPGLHLKLVPARVKHERASRFAKAQFYQQGIHVTRHHCGVLLFVSLAERYVEIVADRGIHEKLGEAHWQAIIELFVSRVRQGRIADGFVEAINACGKAMAEHFPPDPDQSNELSDGLIEV